VWYFAPWDRWSGGERNGGEGLRFAWRNATEVSLRTRLPSLITPWQDHHNQTAHFHTINMEEDRAQVDVGGAVEAELPIDQHEQSRQPKKRFVGRKTAAARTGSHANEVESNGAIQGVPEKI